MTICPMPMKRSRVRTSEARIIERQANPPVASTSKTSAPATPWTLHLIDMPVAASTTSRTNACASARMPAPPALPRTIARRGSGVASRRCSWPTSRSQMTASPKKMAMKSAACAMIPGARYAR